MRLPFVITMIFILAACCQQPVKLDPEMVTVKDICFEVAYFGNNTIGMVEKECDEPPAVSAVDDLREWL